MRNLAGILVGSFLIFYRLHFCIAFDDKTLSFVGLGPIVNEILETLFTSNASSQITDESFERTLTDVVNSNRYHQNNVKEVFFMLDDLPDSRKPNLLKISVIERIFINLTRIKQKINSGAYDANAAYDDINKLGAEIRESTQVLGQAFIDDNIIFELKEHFTKDSKKLEHVCETQKSDMQVLNGFLAGIKTITAQYYLATIFMFEIRELKGENVAESKRKFIDQVNFNYLRTVKKLNDILSETSTELWKCDPREGYNDTIRYTNETDPNFAELRILTQYIVSEQEMNEDAYVNKECKILKCPNITELKKCPGPEKRIFTELNPLCDLRKCPGELIGCQSYDIPVNNLWPAFAKHVRICMNNNPDAYHRYHSVLDTNKIKEPFYCNSRSWLDLRTVFPPAQVYGSQLNTKLRDTFPEDRCDQCNCLCQEKEMYFVDLQSVDADLDKVVTGAQLQVQNRVLRIRIEQANLLANGSIDKSTLEWKPLKPVNETRLQWIYYEYRKFALTPAIRPDDEVVTGLSFHAEAKDSDTVYLKVQANKFDFRAGKIEPDLVTNTLSGNPLEPYDISNRDVSTKSKLENKPDSTDEQYVELTISDSVKDGGQSVVPFIDTQKVSANGPLSGASLFIRGQSGFGGFLAIKLYTFDIRNYVDLTSGL